MTKQDQRHRLLKQRAQMTKQAVDKYSAQIYNSLIQLPTYQTAQCIASYVSIKNEVSTKAAIQDALHSGKQVGVPITQKNGIMHVQSITDLNELKPGQYDLPEPIADSKKVIPPTAIDLAIVPGIAFDRHGHRIGWGKGYYDRYLSQTNATRIGLAYDFQVIDAIPFESHDLKMDWIITETKTIQIHNT